MSKPLLAVLLLVLALSPSQAAITYTFASPFKDYNNKVSFSVKGVATGKSLDVTTNFNPASGWGTCFGAGYYNLNFTTKAVGTLYQTTITNPTGSLSFASGCDLFGTNNGEALVFPGVAVPILSALSVDGAQATIERPCEATGCADPGNGRVIGGYYAQWAVWGRQYNPYTIPFGDLNEIYYAFIGFNPSDGSIKTLDSSADGWGMSAISLALRQYPYLKAFLSFGGWTNNGLTTAPMFERLASSQTSMDRFASEAVALMRKLGFSGIDIDWEWWSDYDDTNAPAKKTLGFVRTLRSALEAAASKDGRPYYLSLAVNGGRDRITAMESPSNPNSVPGFWGQINDLVDQINIMNYDYHGGYDTGKPAYFQANYDFPNTGNNKVGVAEGWSIKESIKGYTGAGVSPNKIVIGIPLYARTMKVAGGQNGGLFQTVSGTGFGDYEQGIFDYKCLMNPVADPVNGCGAGTVVSGITSLTEFYCNGSNEGIFNLFGRAALQCWSYSPSTQTFATYDNDWSVTQKVAMAKTQGMKGVMFWELDGDMKGSASLIAKARAGFKSDGSQLTKNTEIEM